MMSNTKKHWEKVYRTKASHEMSWTEELPEVSLSFVKGLKLDKKAAIIDVGGGESKFVDHLLDLGYKDITVLDISSEALERSKKRLGDRAKKVKWIVSDIREFQPKRTYDFWHDRATFHFLISKEDIESYLSVLVKTRAQFIVIGTFSKNGPEKCSGLTVTQYDESALSQTFRKIYINEGCIEVVHETPLKKPQKFIFCRFEKKD